MLKRLTKQRRQINKASRTKFSEKITYMFIQNQYSDLNRNYELNQKIMSTKIRHLNLANNNHKHKKH